jgi:hypothetical protein
MRDAPLVSIAFASPSRACSGSSLSVQSIRSLSKSTYRGHLCTMVNSQSCNFSFPHRSSASCLLTNVKNAELVCNNVASLLIRLGNDVTNGVYIERNGKCDMSVGESGGGGVSCGLTRKSARRACKDSKNEWCRFQMSTKFEKTEVSSARSSKGDGPSRESISGVKKYYRFMVVVSVDQ